MQVLFRVDDGTKFFDILKYKTMNNDFGIHISKSIHINIKRLLLFNDGI